MKIATLGEKRFSVHMTLIVQGHIMKGLAEGGNTRPGHGFDLKKECPLCN
jgi:hypothetical protein